MTRPRNTSNSEKVITVTKADFPLHCPTADQASWNMHPRVYLIVNQNGKAICPYCGTNYTVSRKN